MHRNHIAVMSADSVQISQNPQLYDFSTNPGKVTGSQLRLLKPGLFGMFAGDSDFDGTINSADYNNFIIAGTNSVYGYVICDFDNDGYVTAYDFALLAPNRKAHISTQIIRN